MKKTASLVVALVLVFGMAVPTLAFWRSSDDTSVRNYARVKNDVEVKADSGDNEIHGKVVRGGKIDTGDSYADALVSNTVNTTVTGGNVEE